MKFYLSAAIRNNEAKIFIFENIRGVISNLKVLSNAWEIIWCWILSQKSYWELWNAVTPYHVVFEHYQQCLCKKLNVCTIAQHMYLLLNTYNCGLPRFDPQVTMVTSLSIKKLFKRGLKRIPMIRKRKYFERILSLFSTLTIS